MAVTRQVTPATCPNCGAQFTAPVENIIDGQDLALKSALLRGQLNVVQCPQCGFTHALSVPVLYYDLEKEVAFVLVQGGLQITNAEQEKMIGDLTNKLVNSLPAEERKFYLLNPKQFLTLDSMVKAVLEADGITPEEIEAQQAKVKLLEEFLQVTDETALKKKVKEQEAELDRQFFEILTASIQEAQMVGNTTAVQTLLGLRTLIGRWSRPARTIINEIDAELGAMFIASQDELLKKLEEAEDDQTFEALIAAGYSLFDYGFFQKLTAQLDEAAANDTKRADQLRKLRTKILDAKDRHEEKLRAGMKKSADLLKKIFQSGQPDRVLAKNIDDIDETFFMILSANIEEAQRQKQTEAAQAMSVIGNMALQMLRERQAQEEGGAPTPVTPNIEIASR
ncbi:MAG TPA: CpXC domain-containing protein [Anaerolineae bacterium]